MHRRGSDYPSFFLGFLLIVLGVFTYIFPEIEYKSKKSTPEALIASPQERAFVVPEAASVSIVALGGLLIIRSFKILRRKEDESH